MEGWRRPDLFRGYLIPDRLSVPGVPENRWAFTLIPGWRSLLAGPLEEICARQWIACNEAVLRFREGEGRSTPFLRISYEELVAEPGRTLSRVAAFAKLEFDLQGGPLPRSNVVSEPEQDKWRRRYGDTIARVEDIIGPTMERLGYLD